MSDGGLLRWQRTRERRASSIPREDVLSMVIPQVDLCGASKGDATGFIVHHAHELGLCRPSALEARGGKGDIPMVASTQTGWLLVKAAICSTSGK